MDGRTDCVAWLVKLAIMTLLMWMDGFNCEEMGVGDYWSWNGDSATEEGTYIFCVAEQTTAHNHCT